MEQDEEWRFGRHYITFEEDQTDGRWLDAHENLQTKIDITCIFLCVFSQGTTNLLKRVKSVAF